MIKKVVKPVEKTYPVTYDELEQLFFAISQGVSFPLLCFIKQRFIAMLILAYSSFIRFEELQFLKIEDVSMIDEKFSIRVFKGKDIQGEKIRGNTVVIAKGF